jgi:hypothetical protein
MLKIFNLIQEVLKAPRVTLVCFGGEDARGIWKEFNRPHPRMPLMRLKTFGVSLQPISEATLTMEGSRFALMRRKVRKAEKSGFTFRQIDPQSHQEEILRINRSSSERQGEPMPENYTDELKVRAYNNLSGDWFGVFDRNGDLQAYTHAPIFGDTFVFSRLLGNFSLLGEGIMYFLIHRTIQEMALRKELSGYPSWAMYDMYIGGGDGLREFKRRSGFSPMRVRWLWVEKSYL